MIKVVHIQWHDSAASTGWHSRRELKRVIKSKLSLCESVGMLVEQNKAKVVIVQTFGAQETSGVFEIPRDCIQSIKTLATLPIKIEL